MRKIQVCLFFFIAISFMNSQGFAQQVIQEEITAQATLLYQSFSKTQQYTGLLAFGDTSRLKWNNLPVGLRARAGTSIANMNNDQRRILHRVLIASLSSQGYLKAGAIMHLDELLNQYYDSLYAQKKISDTNFRRIKDLKWSPGNYYFAFFGNPSQKPWGFKLEGHHLSINFSFIGDNLAVTPLFLGTDPAEYTLSHYAGWRVLGKEEDLGLKLIRSLPPSQQKTAIMSGDVPRDIITSAESGKRLIDYWGIKVSAMHPEHKELVQRILREYVFNLEHEKASMEYEKIMKAGLDNIYFGWIGKMEEKQPHYFVLNGPTFLIEFDNNGGPRNEANHIHTIWREKGNEYGEDMLKSHYQKGNH